MATRPDVERRLRLRPPGHSAILPGMRALIVAAICLVATTARAQRWHVEDLTNGLRFEPSITAIAGAPSDPRYAYAGNQHGRIFFTRDGGKTWEETAALVKASGSFIGARRAQVDLLGDRVQRGPAGGIGIAGNSGLRSSIGQELAQVPGSRYLPRSVDASESIAQLINGALAPPGNFNAYLLPAGNRETGTRGWLKFQLGSTFGWTGRLSFKSQLFFAAAEDTTIQWIDVHPRDPEDVLVASAEGLMRSTDGGYSWPITLAGATPAQRRINVVARNPRDPDHVLVGTGQGLHQSFDGGSTFEPLAHPFVVGGDIQSLAFDPGDPKTVYVGLSWSLVRSRDGGQGFDIIFRPPDPDFSFIRRVALDPNDPRRIYVGTRGGLAISSDGGQTFERAGGPTFMGEWITAVVPTRTPGHAFISTWRDLWQTRDGGKTFEMVLYGATQWAITALRSAGDDTWWLATQAELMRLSRDPFAQRLPRDIVERFRARIAAEPDLNEMIARAQKRAGVWRADLDAMRSRAQYSHVLPRLTVDVRGGRIPANYNAGFVARLPVVNTVNATGTSYAIFGRWDLRALIWRNDQGATAIYRLAGQARGLAQSLREQVIAMYQERQRIILDRLASPRPDRRTALLRDLRFEELTAHLNALTGDVLEPFTAL